MNGPASSLQQDPRTRADLLKRIEALHPVGKPDAAQFVAGARLRLRRGIDQDRALRIVADLQAVGASVEVEANRPPDEAILSLDQFREAEPEVDYAHVINDEMLGQLQSLDGDATPPPPIDRDAATRAEPLRMQPVPIAPPARPASHAVGGDERFLPSGEWHQPMELQLDVAPLPLASPSSPPLDDTVDDAAIAPPSAHGRASRASTPPVEDSWHPVPGRLASGALRKQPPVRIAIGVVLGLGLGWLFAQPYAHRAERHVAALRADADRERYRPVDEAQARVGELDRQADDASSSSAIGMGVIWLVVGGAAFAGWWRLT